MRKLNCLPFDPLGAHQGGVFYAPTKQTRVTHCAATNISLRVSSI